jgi:hypothetical protein
MIFYRPIDGDVHTAELPWRPRTCFLMAAMGGQIPVEVQRARRKVTQTLTAAKFVSVDASSVTTGMDYLQKIWLLAVSCPLGIAIVHEGIRPETMANIYYELGWMQSYGRETLVIKIGDVTLPSDLVRSEYLAVDRQFNKKLKSFLKSLAIRANYYKRMGRNLEKNPILAIDYFRRAYLLTGEMGLKRSASRVFASMHVDRLVQDTVKRLLLNF